MPRSHRPVVKKKSRATTPLDDEPTQTRLRNIVLDKLGTPSDMLKLDVIKLRANHYRVNLWRQCDSYPRITDSFYVIMVNGIPNFNMELGPKYKSYADQVLDSLEYQNS